MNLRELERRYPITLIGLIVSLAYIFYVETIRKEYAEVSFSIMNNANVFDVNEPVKGLDIRYKNQDLLETKEELKLITIKVENTGNVHLTENQYYSKEPFGFKFNSGKVIQVPDIVKSEFDKNNVNIQLNDSLNIIHLPKVPLDVDESYIIKMLYLSTGEQVFIEPRGKISGIEKVTVKNDIDIGESNSTSLFKAILGLAVFVLLLISMGSLVSYIWDKIVNRKKNSLLKKFKKRNPDIILPEAVEYLFMRYSIDEFRALEELFTQSDKFSELIDSDYTKMKALQKQTVYDPYLYKSYDSEFCKGWDPYPLKRVIRTSSTIFNHPNNVEDEDLKNKLKPEFVNDMKLFFEYLKHN